MLAHYCSSLAVRLIREREVRNDPGDDKSSSLRLLDHARFYENPLQPEDLIFLGYNNAELLSLSYFKNVCSIHIPIGSDVS